MELYAKDMFFLGKTSKERIYDCCIHGQIIFRIHDVSLCDDTEWCVSASAFRFLHALFNDHLTDTEAYLIPCCGHTIIPSDDKQNVSTPGCNNGMDYEIIHDQENVIIKTSDGREFTTPFRTFQKADLSFATQVAEFYQNNPPRKFMNTFEREGYSAFVTEWFSLYGKARMSASL